MTHYQFGILAGDESLGAVIDRVSVVTGWECCLLLEGRTAPVFQLHGSCGDDTVSVVFISAAHDLGRFVGALTKVVATAGQGDEFNAGVMQGSRE